MKKILLAFALGTALATAGCQTVGHVVQTTTMATPKQANTLADAVNMDTLAVRTTTNVIRAAKLDRATLLQIEKYRDLVHSALVDLEKANDAHQSLTFAAFNAAYETFVNYNASKGITQ